MSKHLIANVMRNIMGNVIGNVIKNILYSISVPISVFCIYIIINEYTNNKYIAKNTQLITINDTNKMVKTGDIIYFKSHITSFGRLFGARLIGPFTHIGIVIKFPKNNNNYIIELTDRNTLNILGITRSGFHITDLETRIKTYDGKCYLSTLNSSHTPSLNNIKHVIYKIKKKIYRKTIHYPKNIHLYFIGLCLSKYRNYYFPCKKTMCCSEFVKYILKELHVIDRKSLHLGILPSDFRYIKCNNNTCHLYNEMNLSRLSSRFSSGLYTTGCHLYNEMYHVQIN
jgi:hypothetical protein